MLGSDECGNGVFFVALELEAPVAHGAVRGGRGGREVLAVGDAVATVSGGAVVPELDLLWCSEESTAEVGIVGAGVFRVESEVAATRCCTSMSLDRSWAWCGSEFNPLRTAG